MKNNGCSPRMAHVPREIVRDPWFYGSKNEPKNHVPEIARMARLFRAWFFGLLAGVLFCGAMQAVAQEDEARKGFVSARELAESLGVSYQFSPLRKMAQLTKNGKIMQIFLDKKEALVDSKPFSLPGAPNLSEGEVFVPAKSILQIFGSQPDKPSKPKIEPLNQPEPEEPDLETPAVELTETTPATPRAGKLEALPPSQPAPPKLLPTIEQTHEDDELSTLTAVRHSKRDDQTRVVMEFDGPISFKTEPAGSNKYKIRVDGCKNIFPTKRSNPVGRDIKSMNFNSGANKKGLVVSFDVPEGAGAPSVETVTDPYRLVLSFKATPEVLAAAASETAKLAAASGTAQIKPASGTAPLAKTASGAAKLPADGDKGKPEIGLGKVPEAVAASQPAPIPDIIIEVPPASLSRAVFLGRTILIDAGHGGRDAGISIQGLPTEKEITLAIALKLKQTLKNLGLNAALVRSKDVEMTQAERTSFVNRSGADLFVSIHVGAAQDDELEGAACYIYDPAGISFDQDSRQKLSSQLVYQEWSQSYRFDLAKFMSTKINERLIQHLSLKDRGVKSLPLLPLRFLTIPGALVEVGMLSHPLESRKLASPGYQEAVAKSMANGVIDFFNAIKINQD